MHMKGYDAWKLSGPDETDGIGMEEGQPCNRYPEPDEDWPRGYKPKPCRGEIVCEDGVMICNKCRETAV